MKLQPARGYVFVTLIDEIPTDKSSAGFGGKTDKHKPEQPYKFKVEAVGGPRPMDGVMVESEVYVGDIISSAVNNATYREQRETVGFLIDDVLYIPMDFRDILGFWPGAVVRDRLAKAWDDLRP